MKSTKKIVRLLTALWSEGLKRIPYILFILLIIIIFQNISDTYANQRSLNNGRQLIAQNNQLQKDNIKLQKDNIALTKQSKDLAAQSKQYTRCVGEVFARYTQTLVPVVFTDFNDCDYTTKATQGTVKKTQSQSFSHSQPIVNSVKPRPIQTPAKNQPPTNGAQSQPSILDNTTNFIKNIIERLVQ